MLTSQVAVQAIAKCLESDKGHHGKCIVTATPTHLSPCLLEIVMSKWNAFPVFVVGVASGNLGTVIRT